MNPLKNASCFAFFTVASRAEAVYIVHVSESSMKQDVLDTWLLGALGAHLSLVDEMVAKHKSEVSTVPADWQALLDGQLLQTFPSFLERQAVDNVPSLQGDAAVTALQRESPPSQQSDAAKRALALHWLLQAYRTFGHQAAQINPLPHLLTPVAALEPATYGLTEADLAGPVPSELFSTVSAQTVTGWLAQLRARYCGHIGLEFMHIPDANQRQWFIAHWEQHPPTALVATQQRYLLDRLLAAEAFERFVHTKYVGAKRFSLEGGESLISCLDTALELLASHGVTEVILGMPHRGRLNVLTHITGKPARALFSEFDDVEPETMRGRGDVKYHLGHSSDYTTYSGKKIHVSLTCNPSHLEAVDPVAVGRVYAQQQRRGDIDHRQVTGILMHGDAAFSGQGVVAETLNMSQVPGYNTGGTVHIVVNNQLGFTTNPQDARSTTYCTDIAKMIHAPVIHVNGDDPEAVVHAAQLAVAYQRTFHRDVVIDLVCYRRYGHNETDEPSFTQPLLYQSIAKHPSVATQYAETLLQTGVLTQAEVAHMTQAHQERLEAELATAKQENKRLPLSSREGVWASYQGGAYAQGQLLETGVAQEELKRLAEQLVAVPPLFTPHPKILRLLQQRAAMGQGAQPLDWAMAEALAFASLLANGVPVRLLGQDCRRGTFSQRQALLVDIQDGKEYIPLQHLSLQGTQRPAPFDIHDSVLSEFAAMGFEYGYSLESPEALVLWEAQFGDFVNGAQVILDQFLSAGEAKWGRLSGLVLLLPHSYEGQGPEHSSARLERFLQLCAEDNWQVVYPTTPAQYFHLLRRQVKSSWRKPLVVMTPKSLLRNPVATSSLEALTTGGFQPCLPDTTVEAAQVQRVLLCTGKIYYDLLEERTKRKDSQTALVRVEQLYPLDTTLLQQAVAPYAAATTWKWVQEEPANMGAQSFLQTHGLEKIVGHPMQWISRPEAASPATGSHKAHAFEQRDLLEAAFAANSLTKDPTTAKVKPTRTK